MTATGEAVDPATTEMADSPMHSSSVKPAVIGLLEKNEKEEEEVKAESPESPALVDASLVSSAEGGLGDSIVEGSVVVPPTSPLDDETSLFISARYGEFSSILKHLSEDPTKWDMVLRARDNEGHSLLHWAALFDSADFVRASCREIEDRGKISEWVNHRSKNGQTAVMWCCIKGNLTSLKTLHKDFKANVSGHDSLRADSVILATQHHQHNTVLLLQKWRHALEMTDVSGCTAVHWAAYKGDVTMLRIFSYFNTDMNAVDGQGMTPLHRAVSEGQSDCALFLVEKCGANPELKNYKDESALDISKRLENRMLFFALQTKKDAKESSSFGAHWGLPIVFMACMSITLICFLAYFVKTGSFYLTSAFVVCAVLANALYVNLLVADPGFVPRRRVGQSAVEELQEKLDASGPLDKDLGIGKICVTCWERKELDRRMKHCAVCDRCVDEFDHHCGWINNCVAEKNHRRFVLMVAFVLAGMTLFSIISVQHALNSPLSWLDLLLSKPLLLPAWIIHLMVVPWLAILCFMQLRSIALNLNTNEMINMHRYAHFWEENDNDDKDENHHHSVGRHKCTSSQGKGCGHSKQPAGKKFRNPFDQGVLGNCKYFWFSKGTKSRYAPVPSSEVELARMV